jgi:hypothetical protein
VIGPVLLSGSGAGSGLFVVSGTIPPGTPPGTVYVQGFVIDPGAPAGYSASNGVVLTVP